MSRKKATGVTDILAFGAHPDDVDLCMGGCLAAAAARGGRVDIVDATRGELGTRGSAKSRAREAEKAARALGARSRDNLGLPDGFLEPDETLRRALVEMIRLRRPKVVLAPYWESRHPDHRALSIAVKDACFLAGVARWPAAGEPWKVRKLLFALAYTDARPTFYVDVSTAFDAKLRAIRAFRSQVTGAKRLGDIFPAERPLLDTIRALHSYWGAQAQTLYAEPYLQREPILIEDVTKLPLDSI